METARIAELLQPFLNGPGHSERSEAPAVVSSTQLKYISTYIDLLLRWNARINLTAIRQPEEIVTRHFGESLFAARHLFPTKTTWGRLEPALSETEGTVQAEGSSARTRLIDVGSGAGFPGIPIKIWASDIDLTLIESNHKKAAFLREVARALTWTDVNIQNARAETVTATFHVVTLRAVERFNAILPTAAALVAPSGRLALLIGAAQETQARSTLPHLAWSTAVPVPKSRSRILLVAHRPQ